MKEQFLIRGITTERDGKPITLLNAEDIANWLRYEFHPMSPADRAVALEIADSIEGFVFDIAFEKLVENDILET